MKYRWGFIEGGNFTECKPVVEDDTAIDFAPQTSEVFYRAKLNGSLTFRFGDYDAIIARGFNYTHVVALQYYDADLNGWSEVWRGRFALTDCEINYDTQTITVQPETLDRYTKILDHLEDEYNLLKLAPTQQPVSMQIRPVVQIYSIGSDKITNITTNGYYEQDVISPAPQIWDYMMQHSGATGADAFYFAVPYAEGSQYPICMPKAACSLWVQDGNDQNLYFFAEFNLDGTHTIQTIVNDAQLYTYDPATGIKTIVATVSAECYYDPVDNHRDTYFRFFYGGDTFELYYETEEVGADIPTEANMPAGYTFIKAKADQFVSRILMNTDATSVTLAGRTAPAIELDQTNDIAPIANYNKIIPLDITNIFSIAEFQEEVTEYGLADQEGYFKKYDPGTEYYFRPVNISKWCLHSVWAFYANYGQEDYNKQIVIRDCYTLPSVIFRLMKKADVNLNFVDNAVYSAFLFGDDNHITDNAFYLCLTPRSNIISSYYDTPALNAPITLQVVLNMLKSLFQVYWYIDENNYLHFEHISYFENGYTYSDSAPGLLVDLESHTHTRTRSNKVYGQNKVKFDKQDMPAQITFSFDDTQTRPFDGYPIKCDDAYIQQGSKEEKTISKFDTDVDMILATPSEFSKDGFVLLACPYVAGARSYSLGIKKNFKIVDEDGSANRFSIQNYDCAVAYVSKYWWRYKLPCENITVNNENTTAITTGRFKNQSLEFADVVMADILADIDNCNKVIRTQQGDGKIKTLSINLNSLKAKGDLLFDFIGRWFYLKGTGLNGVYTIDFNGVSTQITVSGNNFIHKYKEPINELKFLGADIVSVNFADCDKLENLTSCDDMFNGCAELLSVDFGGKKLAAVTSANSMFAGCSQLTTLICPASSTWKPDISFVDSPALTVESVYSLIDYLYSYDSGVHTIDLNATMWNAIDPDIQTDITTKANAKGWQISTATAYFISGTSTAAAVYATINGASVEIPVAAGAFNYQYYAPITSIKFENDSNLTTVDFSLSDGLAGVSTFDDLFKNCAGLTSVDLTGCDLSNIASATDCFAGCVALSTLTIPSGAWKPDVDLSAAVLSYSEMQNVVGGLYTYATGTHTITFNSTIWDALSVAQQQTISDAAQLKYWTTNTVAVVYYIRGKSSNVNGQETFTITFINDGSLTPSAQETITCNVDGNGDWSFEYSGKKIYSLNSFAASNHTCLTFDFSAADDLTQLNDMTAAFFDCNNAIVYATQTLDNVKFAGKNSTSVYGAFQGVGGVNLPNATFASLIKAEKLFRGCKAASISLPEATFNSLLTQEEVFTGGMFSDLANCTSISLPKATFASLTTCKNMFADSNNLTSISMPNATFKETLSIERMFANCTMLQGITISKATFEKVTTAKGMFFLCSNLLQFIEPTTLNFAELTNVGDAASGGYIGMFQGCFALQKVDMHTQTFPKLQYSRMMFAGCYSLQEVDFSAAICDKLAYTARMFDAFDSSSHPSVLTTISVSQNSTAILPTSTAANAPMNLQYLPLNYTSMLKVANWLSNLTGHSAHTCTFKSSAWNALSTAEQSTIDGILSGKNWTRAIA